MEAYGGGERGGLYTLSLYGHHQNDSCNKMGSDESHFNVSLTVRDKATRQWPQITTFEEKGEPKRIRTEVPLFTNLTPYHYAKPTHRPKQLVSSVRFLDDCPFSSNVVVCGHRLVALPPHN